MSELDELRSEVRAELDAYSETVDGLEAAVADVATVVTENRLHDLEEGQTVERTTDGTVAVGTAAD